MSAGPVLAYTSKRPCRREEPVPVLVQKAARLHERALWAVDIVERLIDDILEDARRYEAGPRRPGG